MKYNWDKLNRLQKGTFGEYFAKMEFAMYGFLVFTAEVDDRGIDFVVKTPDGQYFDVQVKTITGNNYTFIAESKFNDKMLICLVTLENGEAPIMYLFRKKDWENDSVGLLKYSKFEKSKEPEFGFHLSEKKKPVLGRFQFEEVVKTLVPT